ncbi:glycoside hydrolase family 3 N-terminal domain-containing protein [Sunxiuqinia indica]|uniref:glycoside hydrolase family 3 N-terminal domain-containing protein n=1 Tax=Sunxiuqinia indica TaxID=2692584 RepID=UPI00135CA2C2|nr:glycoside hydrolase family 3 N-terminal domain-containing protein [Sunxiuqinia indica]
MQILTRLLFSVFLCLPVLFSFAENKPDFLNYTNDSWVDSTLKQMSLDEKIGQLFIAQVYSQKDLPENAEILSKIKDFHIGGIIFMQGTPERQAKITNQLQAESEIPLLITMDGEWGPGFRLTGAPKYPVQMALGAIQQDSLIYQMGYEIGEQMKRIGVHINFAPVADVNSNPDNPVINYRSFGEDPQNVARKTWLYTKGMQDAGILAVAKHFPGHGDTQTDSHLGLPVIKHSIERLDSIELFPFTYLIKKGVGGIMTAHLHVEAYDPESNIPASLSTNLVQNKLIDDLGFQGLVITDAMNMHGVSKQFSDGEATVKALIAGNDMMEIVPNLGERIKAVKQAIENGDLSEDAINHKCRKILALKKWLKLDEYKKCVIDGIATDYDKPEYQATKRQLHEQSLTLLNNNNQLLPLQKLDTLKIAAISIGTAHETYFQKMLANYMAVDFFNLAKNATQKDIEKLKLELKPYNLIVVGIHDMRLSISGHYGLSPIINNALEAFSPTKQITVLFGNPYALNYLNNAKHSDALLITYQENQTTQELAAQAIFGGIDVNGKLPVRVNDDFLMNQGISIKKNGRFKYSIPEEVGMSSSFLNFKIDSIVNRGLKEKAFPGCQILVAKDGQVVFHKCYGYFTYDKKRSVEKTDIYDWASLTKITGPLPALIKLHSEKKIDLDLPFSFYWPDFRNSNKDKITSREILAHQAGLLPWINYYEKTVRKNGQLKSSVFRDHPTTTFNLRVSSHLYMNNHYVDEIYSEIRDSRLLPRKKYTYSGLGFYLFPRVIEDLTGENYENYLKKEFYLPLGASSVTYNAYRYFPQQVIVPTEQDNVFRKELLQGFVHDEGASMMGGVSGNAGLFGTATDLAKIMQMYLQYGKYANQQLLDSASVREFTRIQYPENENRRGLGFDKPYIDNRENKLKDAYPAVSASPESFGHSGYTGTFAWADPENDLLFIFFSNRVYPTRENSGLFDLNIRPALHQVLYDSLK